MMKHTTLLSGTALLFILFAVPACLKDTSLATTIPPEPPPFSKKMIWKEAVQKIGSSHWEKLSDGDTLTLRLNPIVNATNNNLEGMYGAYQYRSTNLGTDLDSIGGVSITDLDISSPVIFTSTGSSKIIFINYNEKESEIRHTLVRDTVGIFQYTEVEDTLFLKDTLNIPYMEMKYIRVK